MRRLQRHVVQSAVVAAAGLGGLSLGMWKAIAAAAVFLIAAVGCWAAKCLQTGGTSTNGEKLLIFGNILSAGVLLAASLVHMLPDSTESLEGALPNFPLPLAPAIAGGAFCFLVVLEEAIEAVEESGHEAEPDLKRRGSAIQRHVSRRGSAASVASMGHHAPTVAQGAGAVAEVKSFLLFAALSFHSVAEGLGLGAAEDAGVFVSVLVATLAHKGLAGFALGSSMAQSGIPDWRFWTFVFIFSISTPIGTLIGALIAGAAGASEGLTSGICLALASGTFLQVSSMELLPGALAAGKYRLIASVALVIGFCFMTLLAIWA